MSFWNFLSPLKKLDWLLLAAAFLLAVFGLVALYSVSLSLGQSGFLNFQKQIIFLIIGLALFFLMAFVDYRFFKIFSWLIYLVGLLLLAAVLIFGQTKRGTTGWFSFSFLNFQPVELAKLALLIFLSKYFSSHTRKIHELRHVVITGLAAAVMILLVLLQPDLGSALILVFLWLSVLLIVGIRRTHFLGIILLICLLLVAAWFFVFQDYQKERIMTFLNPSADPLRSGYNVKQSVIAIGSGQLVGRGLSFGSQSQLKFLPESQTDFIFAVIAEELGLVGVILVLLFWGLLFYRLIRGARLARDDFGAVLIMGLVGLIVIQVFINIGTNVGLVPVTGISLPLVSYGGSGLIMFLMMLGLAESVIVRGRER